MRSTIKINTNNAINQLSSNYMRVSNLMTQMSTGQRVNKPSDDPLATNAGMRLDRLITMTQQYNRNLEIGSGFLSLSDASLDSVNKMLASAKGLTIQSASETTSNEMRRANAVEVNNILQEIVSIANRSEGNRYLFGGTKTGTQPYTIVGAGWVHYQGNENSIKVLADTNTHLPINVTGSTVFGSLTSVVEGRTLAPDINMGAGSSTRLEDLNFGAGVPSGSIRILYSSYPNNGLEVDLSGADTIEDVKNIIEKATRDASLLLDPLGAVGDPRRDRYVSVTINAENNGIQLVEIDPSGDPFDPDSKLEIRDVGSGQVAQRLGIRGSVNYTNIPGPPPASLPIPLVGSALNPVVNPRTQLADMKDYADGPLTITNGALPGFVSIREIDDAQNHYDRWSLDGLTKGVNTGANGQLYVRMTATANPNEWTVDLFKGADLLPEDRVATGTLNAGGTMKFDAVNDSGITGAVSVNPPVWPANAPVTSLVAEFDETFRATLDVPAFQRTLTVGASDDIDMFRLRGMTRGEYIPPEFRFANAAARDAYFANPLNIRRLEQGVVVQINDLAEYQKFDGTNWVREPMTTDHEGNFRLVLSDIGGVVHAQAFNPAGMLMATGTLPAGTTQGELVLTGTGEFPQLKGSVKVDFNGGPGDPREYDMKATFATVQDLMNAVASSNTYTQARVNANGTGIDFVSSLAGANLVVSERVEDVDLSGLHATQVSGMDLVGVARGFNTDSKGRIYTVIETDDQVPANTTVSFYNADPRLSGFDKETALVGTARFDGAPPPGGALLSIASENDSGLSGTFRLDSIVLPVPPQAKTVSEPIVANLNAMRPTGNQNNTIRNTEIHGIRPGVNSDSDGNLFASLDAAGIVSVYSDRAKTQLVALGNAPAAPSGQVTFTAQNNSGLSGTMFLDLPIVPPGDPDIILTAPRGLQSSGHKREDNIFATLNDVRDEMIANNTDRLHELLGDFKRDEDRVLLTRADIGARVDRIMMLESRHRDEVINFGQIRATRIDLDYSDAVVKFQAMQNVFEASLRVSGQIIPMSLVDFI